MPRARIRVTLRRSLPREPRAIAYRFLHTADLHLDSPLSSLSLKNDALAERIGAASRTALSRIADLCLEERLDALVIAGDLFDGEIRSAKTAAFVSGIFRRLDAAGVRVLMVRGNHDAASRIARTVELPPSARLFETRGGTETLAEAGIAFHGVSYPDRRVPESLLPRYPAPLPGMANIGLLHTSLGGAEGHDTYAPCSVAELIAHGYDYWALGHVHIRKVHAESPRVVMPGMPQGRDIGEAGAKSVTLVTVTDGGMALETRSVAAAEFAETRVQGAADEPLDALLARSAETLAAEAERAEADALVSRLVLAAPGALGWQLRRDRDIALERLAERLEGLDVWVEALKIETPAPTRAAPTTGDPVAELGATMAALLDDPGEAAEAGRLVETTLAQMGLPAALRDAFGTDEESRAETVRRLSREGMEEVLARLRSTAAEGEA